VNPLVALTVQAAKRRCDLASQTGSPRGRDGVGGYAEAKIKNYQHQIKVDTNTIKTLTAEIAGSQYLDATKVTLNTRLSSFQAALSTLPLLLIQAKQVERPKLTYPRRRAPGHCAEPGNTVLIAALIGLISA
jgi:hypothetical protein